MADEERVLGILGGSGLYEAFVSEVGAGWSHVDTPWGEASDAIYQGEIGGVRAAFLPRHGRGHRVPPSEINYRANIDALKRVGVTDLISLSACGSFREDLPPGSFVLIDQFIDRTHNRETSFFGLGCVAHVSMAHPVCPNLLDALDRACGEIGVSAFRGGVYVAIEGPQFSTVAESRLYKSWGCDVIGMTNLPEAKLAREAEIPYATVAMVTDFDSWREGDSVEVADVLKVISTNADKARALVRAVAPILGPTRVSCPIGADRALEHAILTPPEARDPTLMAKLDAVAGRVLKAS